MAMGDSLPRTAGGTESAGQYLKRFRVKNDGPEPRRALFAVYIQAEINGGIGEPGLSWHDGDRTLLAINRGHAHANRKLARDATVEFALAQHIADTLGSPPLHHVLAEEPVKVRVPVERITADDQAGDDMGDK